MKGLDSLVAAMLLIVITIAAIAIVFETSGPSLNRSMEILLFQEAKNNLMAIDNSIKSVMYQGEGAVKAIDLTVTGGEYTIDGDSGKITFIMESPSQIYSDGLSNTTDGILITGKTGGIEMELEYDTASILGDGIFSSGKAHIIITNDGYNEETEKTEVSLAVS